MRECKGRGGVKGVHGIKEEVSKGGHIVCIPHCQ